MAIKVVDGRVYATTLKEACEFFGRGPTNVPKYITGAKGPNGFDLSACAVEMKASYEKIGKSSSATSDYNAARVKKTEVEAARIRLRLEKETGQLVSASEIRSQLISRAANVLRQRIQTLIQRWVVRLPSNYKTAFEKDANSELKTFLEEVLDTQVAGKDLRETA